MTTEETPLISHDNAQRTLNDALRLRVGQGKRYSFASLADATGICERTLRSYVDGATPGLGNWLTLCAALGPSFTSDILACAGQRAKAGTDETPDHYRVLCQLGEMTTEMAKALEDGHVDHREAAILAAAAKSLIERLQPLTSGAAS